MAFNGSGVFSRIYNWVTDRGNSINIDADRMDEEMDGFKTAFDLCVLKDGQQTITADLPMAGFKHTGVGNASARNHYAAVGQVQDGGYNYIDGGGTANAQTLTVAPAITAYAAGQLFTFKAAATNTGAATLAVSGLAAIAIQNDGRALIGGEIQSGNIVIGVVKDASGTKTFQLLMEGGTVAYTPVITFATAGDLSVAYDAQVGQATRRGPFVIVQFAILTTTFTHTTASGALRLTGLPTSRTVASGLWGVGLGQWGGITKASYTAVGAYVTSNTALANFSAGGSAQASSDIVAADMPSGGTVRLTGTLIYPLP